MGELKEKKKMNESVTCKPCLCDNIEQTSQSAILSVEKGKNASYYSMIYVMIPSLVSFFIFAAGFYLLHSITTDASMRQVRQKIARLTGVKLSSTKSEKKEENQKNLNLPSC